MANKVELSQKAIDSLSKSLERSFQGAFSKSRRPSNEPSSSGGSIRDAELELNTQIRKQRELRKEIERLTKALRKSSGDAATHLKEGIDARRKEMDAYQASINAKKNEILVLRAATSRVDEFGDAVTSASKKVITATTKYVADTLKWNRDFGRGVDKAISDYQKSLSTGLSVDYITSMTLGLTQESFLEINREHRRTSEAFNNEGRVFSDRMRDVSRELFRFVGDLEDANKLAAGLQTTSRSMGLYGNMAEDYADALANTFKKFNSALSMTDEEFLNLSKSISNDNEVRKISARLAGTERKEFSLGINKLSEYFASLGYAGDQIANLTKEFIKTFKGDDPKERYKQTMKEVALGGIVGLSPEEMAFYQSTATMNSRERAANAEEITRIREQLGAGVGSMLEGSFGSQLIGGTLISKGLASQPILDANLHNMQREAMGGGIDLEARMGDLDIKRNDTLVEILKNFDHVRNILGNAPAMIATAIVSSLSTVIATSAGRRFFGNGGGRGGRGGGRGGSGFNVGRMGRIGGIAGAGLGAYQLYDAHQNGGIDGSDLAGFGGSVGGGFAGMKAGAMLGAIGGPIGVAIGGIAGGVIGSVIGSEVTTRVYDKFSKSVEDSNRVEEKRLKMLQKYSDSSFALERAAELAYGSVSKQEDMLRETTNPNSPSYQTEQIMSSRAEIDRRLTGEEAFGDAFKRKAFSNRLYQVDGFEVSEAFKKYGGGEKEMATIARKVAEEQLELSAGDTEKFVEEIVSGILKGQKFSGDLVSFGKDKSSTEIEILSKMFDEFKAMNSNMEKIVRIEQEERDRNLLKETDTSVVDMMDRTLRKYGRGTRGPTMG